MRRRKMGRRGILLLGGRGGGADLGEEGDSGISSSRSGK